MGTSMISFKNVTLAKGIGILLAIAAVGGGTAYAGSVVSRNNIMDQSAAETFAFVDAGVNKNDVTSLHSHLERDRGKYVYDIEFHVGDKEYEYEILAEDGMILNKKVEGENTVSHGTEEAVKTASGQSGVSGQGAEGIQGNAGQEQDAQGSKSDVRPEQDTQENNSGVGQEQAVERNKDGSEVQDQPVSSQDTSVAGQTASPIDYIGVDRAKQIALDHAGLREDEVIFSKAKFDKEKDDDDESPEYEIEYYKDNIEYEYEIDALTGKINEYSAEPDRD